MIESVGVKKNKVAILADGFIQWGGGIDFIRTILNGLLADNSDKYEIHLLIPEDSFITRIRKSLGIFKRFMESRLIREARTQTVMSKFDSMALMQSFSVYQDRVFISFYSNYPTSLSRNLKEKKIDVVIPSFKSLGINFPTPWVGYVADFQHRYLPELFTRFELKSRDRMYGKTLSSAEVIIVNSKATGDDIRKFYPASKAMLISLPFAPYPQREWLEGDFELMASRYGLPKNYFLISNQFWIHKDHATAFKAFRIFLESIQSTEDDWVLACTGKMEDYRSNEHIQDLLSLIDNLGLKSAIKLLGYMDKMDQVTLMRGAVALVQPTRFEGGPGGGAVYDAVAVGVPVIVTDIPVNREIETATEIRFFPPGNAELLAMQMTEIANNRLPRMTKEELVEAGEERRNRLGFALRSAIKVVLHDF